MIYTSKSKYDARWSASVVSFILYSAGYISCMYAILKLGIVDRQDMNISLPVDENKRRGKTSFATL